MIASVLRKEAYVDYRVRLELLRHIPINASGMDIHEIIEGGFLANTIAELCNSGLIGPTERNQIISPRAFKARLATRQPLTVHQSDQLFRFAHIIAMAVTVFGNDKKAKRWLSKPKERFSGETSFAMLSTFQGTLLVEEMLVQVEEGIAF